MSTELNSFTALLFLSARFEAAVEILSNWKDSVLDQAGVGGDPIQEICVHHLSEFLVVPVLDVSCFRNWSASLVKTEDVTKIPVSMRASSSLFWKSRSSFVPTAVVE